MALHHKNHTDHVPCLTQLFCIFAYGKSDVILQVSHTMYLK